jgi:protein-L-isoaspartate(D-aspartate) O-methyltransferase
MTRTRLLVTAAMLIAMNACSPTPSDGQGDGVDASPPAASPSAAGHPRSDERAAERAAMVAAIEARGVADARVLDALRAVPRHWFVPPAEASEAYADNALPIGLEQTISQPYVVALMTEALALQPGERVLEIGTGSGYQAAVLSELTDEVYTIEIVPELARTAAGTFEQHGYDTIHRREGDGYGGWPEEAPFDAIVVTAAPDHVPPALADQLKPGGRMVLPKGPEGYQQLVLLTKRDDGRMTQRVLAPVRFVPMTGEARGSGG